MNAESNKYEGWWTREQEEEILAKKDLNLIKTKKIDEKIEFGM